jgi:hypothetical protein
MSPCAFTLGSLREERSVMENKKRAIGLLAFLLLLLGLLQFLPVQAGAEERVRVQVAGLV